MLVFLLSACGFAVKNRLIVQVLNAAMYELDLQLDQFLYLPHFFFQLPLLFLQWLDFPRLFGQLAECLVLFSSYRFVNGSGRSGYFILLVVLVLFLNCEVGGTFARFVPSTSSVWFSLFSQASYQWVLIVILLFYHHARSVSNL